MADMKEVVSRRRRLVALQERIVSSNSEEKSLSEIPKPTANGGSCKLVPSGLGCSIAFIFVKTHTHTKMGIFKCFSLSIGK
nr:hypothetical protein Itr_chr06CG05970 [Ipomoea trifida]